METQDYLYFFNLLNLLCESKAQGKIQNYLINYMIAVLKSFIIYTLQTVIRSRRMRLAGHITCIWPLNTYKISARTFKGRNQLRDLDIKRTIVLKHILEK
jgi:hypothetical protein